jgi:iron(III) transport system substrate-binding protein
MKFSAAAALILACAALPPAGAQDWSDVVAAAKKEATVTVYHSQLGAPHWKVVVDAFQKKYGIEVKEFDARASEITERVRVEQSSGRAIADVEFHGLATIVDQRKSDFIAELGAIPNAKNIRPVFRPPTSGRCRPGTSSSAR